MYTFVLFINNMKGMMICYYLSMYIYIWISHVRISNCHLSIILPYLILFFDTEPRDEFAEFRIHCYSNKLKLLQQKKNSKYVSLFSRVNKWAWNHTFAVVFSLQNPSLSLNWNQRYLTWIDERLSSVDIFSLVFFFFSLWVCFIYRL